MLSKPGVLKPWALWNAGQLISKNKLQFTVYIFSVLQLLVSANIKMFETLILSYYLSTGGLQGCGTIFIWVCGYTNIYLECLFCHFFLNMTPFCYSYCTVSFLVTLVKKIWDVGCDLWPKKRVGLEQTLRFQAGNITPKTRGVVNFIPDALGGGRGGLLNIKFADQGCDNIYWGGSPDYSLKAGQSGGNLLD